MLATLRSKFLCPLLLGAGALASTLLPATAGDKIIYTSSASSDKLSAPEVERQDREQNKNPSSHFSSLDPVMEDFTPPAEAAVVLRPSDLNRLTALTDPLRMKQPDRADRVDSASDTPDDEKANQDDNSDTTKSEGKQVWSAEKGWHTDTSTSRLRGSDNLGSQYSSSESRKNSSDTSGRQTRRDDSSYGDSSDRDSRYDKSGFRRTEGSDAYGNSDSKKTSLMEQINRFSHATSSSYSSLDPNNATDSYGLPATQNSSLSSPGASLFSSSLTPDSSDNSNNQTSHFGADFGSLKSSAKDIGATGFTPDASAWQSPPAVSQPSEQYHPAYVPPQPALSPMQQHPASLAFPKQPGAVW